MKKYATKPENQSRTINADSRPSKQTSISDILQAYRNKTLQKDMDVMGGKVMQCEKINKICTPLVGNVAQMVKVYVIEDLNLLRQPKRTFLTDAAARVKAKQDKNIHNYNRPAKPVDEFHNTTSNRIKKRWQFWRQTPRPIADVGVDETIVFKSHGGAGTLLSKPTFGNYNPEQFAKILIDGNYLPDNYRGRITLSGCNTAVEYKGIFGSGFFAKKSFAESFKNELNNYANNLTKPLGGFEVKGTLGTARTDDDGRLLIDKDGFQGNWKSIPKNKKIQYRGGSKAVRGKEGKKLF